MIEIIFNLIHNIKDYSPDNIFISLTVNRRFEVGFLTRFLVIFNLQTLPFMIINPTLIYLGN